MNGTKTRQTTKEALTIEINATWERWMSYLCVTLRLHTVVLVSRLEEARQEGKSSNRAQRETVTGDILAKIFAGLSCRVCGKQISTSIAFARCCKEGKNERGGTKKNRSASPAHIYISHIFTYFISYVYFRYRYRTKSESRNVNGRRKVENEKETGRRERKQGKVEWGM